MKCANGKFYKLYPSEPNYTYNDDGNIRCIRLDVILSHSEFINLQKVI